jgi:type I restriction enzyme S subunit
MNSDWKQMKLIDVIQKTETINPQKTPNVSFEYIDISSICNKRFLIQETSTILGKDAPSRARKLVRTGDTLFATVRPTLKRIAQVPKHLDAQVCSTGYFILRPKDFVEGKFLFYYLFTEYFMGAMEQLQKGASYPAVNDGQVSGQTIFIPLLSEQKRIVAILDEAFEGIDRAIANTEKNLANSRELFESYLNTIFTQKGDGWVENKLGNICTFEGGSQPPKAVFSTEKKDGYIRLIQIRDYKSDNYIIYIPKKDARRFCQPDDVMIGRYGPPLFQILRGLEGAYNVALMKAIPNEEIISKDFLFYFLKNRKILNYIINSSSRTAGQTGLNKATIEPYPIAFPTLKEQAVIVSQLQELKTQTQDLETIYRQKIAALRELKQSILQKAFTGELTTDTKKTTEEEVAA